VGKEKGSVLRLPSEDYLKLKGGDKTQQQGRERNSSIHESWPAGKTRKKDSKLEHGVRERGKQNQSVSYEASLFDSALTVEGSARA